jgi:fibronectin type 3 domain-containing protein
VPPPPPTDQTPPPGVTDLSVVETTSSSLRLGWSAVSDPSGVRYEVYGSPTSGFTAEAGNLLASTSSTSFTHGGLAPGTSYYYRVRAVDGANNVGPLSQQAGGRTPDGPDTTAPSTVSDLHVTKRTASSVALEWDPASDDRGVIAYRVLRGDILIAQTPGTRYTDDEATPGTLTYGVRAVDAAGNVGAATSVNVPPAAQDNGPLRITRVGVTVRGDTATIDWSTDEPASGTVALDAGQPSQTVATGAAFKVTFSDLAPIEHSFHIRMATVDGRTASRDGHFAVRPQGASSNQAGTNANVFVLEQAPAGLSDHLQAILGVPVASDDLYLSDDGGDGSIEGLADMSRHVETIRTLSRQKVVLVQSVDTGRYSVLDPVAQAAHPVAQPNAVVRAEERQADLHKLVIEIPSKSGWVLVQINDPDPTQAILGVQRSDGSALEPDAAWRQDGRIAFLDDPVTTYVLALDNAGSTVDVDASSGGAHAARGDFPWGYLLIGGVTVVVVAVLVLARRNLAP